MPRRPTGREMESPQDLAKKAEVLERELAVQREAMERLKQMSSTKRRPAESRETA